MRSTHLATSRLKLIKDYTLTVEFISLSLDLFKADILLNFRLEEVNREQQKSGKRNFHSKVERLKTIRRYP